MILSPNRRKSLPRMMDSWKKKSFPGVSLTGIQIKIRNVRAASTAKDALRQRARKTSFIADRNAESSLRSRILLRGKGDIDRRFDRRIRNGAGEKLRVAGRVDQDRPGRSSDAGRGSAAHVVLDVLGVFSRIKTILEFRFIES